ncbi:hypothetical protein ACWEIM_33145, partial [Streptomyces sp. NPDC004778]
MCSVSPGKRSRRRTASSTEPVPAHARGPGTTSVPGMCPIETPEGPNIGLIGS